jgi:glycosyltransferase involved in cell wall biosynthesis
VSSAPRVSVVIPAYNRARYLPAAVASVLRQSYADFELIVVDDGSTDSTPEVVRGIDDRRLRLVTNPVSLGIAGARNRGLDCARGEYVAALDSDDIAYPQRLARQVSFLDAHPDFALVGSWSSWMDEWGRALRGVKRRPVDADDAAALLIFNSCLTQSSVMIRTATLREYRYDEAFTMSSDFELWARLAAGGCRMASLPEVLVCQREHPSRTTREKAERVVECQLAIYRWQLERLGVRYDEVDLLRHHILPRSPRKAGPTEPGYLEWAEVWLLGLEEANRRRGWFEPRAFARVLGRAWATACYRAGVQHRWRALRRFAGSPLLQPALAAMRRQAALELTGGLSRARRVPHHSTA